MSPGTLHVSGLAPEADDGVVEAALANALGDAMLSCRVVRDRQTGTCRGFCFVTFADQDSATAALPVLNSAILPPELGATITAQLSVPKPQKSKSAAANFPDLRLRNKRTPSRTKHPQSITCSDQKRSLNPKTGKLKAADRGA